MKEKFRAKTLPMWRVMVGGEARTSANGNQPTLPKEPGYLSDPLDTHWSNKTMTVVQRSSSTVMEDLRDGDDVVEVSRTTGQESINPSTVA